ncbi:MAG: septal ring lytic transglycosylase RlpA family protein, partial [Geobacteraceae bacterium]|nr:septal ring lytic transglycosylase RlpA family protein [Geobacteraceae bacterium]
TVNDRCRDRSFPFIDLSRAAARKLGYLGKGTARVRIIPLDNKDPDSLAGTERNQKMALAAEATENTE